MPVPEHLYLFVTTLALVLVIPGPDFVLVTRNTLARGKAAGLATAAGTTTALAGYATLAVAGLTVLIASSGTALLVLRVAGACYLSYLGVSALVGVWRAHRAPAPAAERTEPDQRGGAPFWQGVMNNALNPKALAFFVTLLPQFVTPGPEATAQTALLGGIVVAMAATWWLVYVLAIARLADLMRRRRVRQGIELTSGITLTAFGIALALAA
ncbi:threonine/homoserine/homoserine lactone efflux protein [Haloactinospora alba]|uniref:Threonine/homoserine/homoserine lactone efflux protein n=1 Tax=Haloactinospora alba TaxID=405555 RepID=A0A543NJ35_9ACTN|nr:LysE family translocator [Haloactinospora alba]TQN31855.1 threonine/homoserine/homoserine lactone efflux protein [Haloactinospora alba]